MVLFSDEDPKYLEWHCSLVGLWLHKVNKIFGEESVIGFSNPSLQNHFIVIDNQQQAYGDLCLS